LSSCGGFFYVRGPKDEKGNELNGLDIIIKNVVRSHSWAPNIIGALFIDDIDYKGIEFWDDDILCVNNEMQPKTKPKVK